MCFLWRDCRLQEDPAVPDNCNVFSRTSQEELVTSCTGRATLRFRDGLRLREKLAFVAQSLRGCLFLSYVRTCDSNTGLSSLLWELRWSFPWEAFGSRRYSCSLPDDAVCRKRNPCGSGAQPCSLLWARMGRRRNLWPSVQRGHLVCSSEGSAGTWCLFVSWRRCRWQKNLRFKKVLALFALGACGSQEEPGRRIGSQEERRPGKANCSFL